MRKTSAIHVMQPKSWICKVKSDTAANGQKVIEHEGWFVGSCKVFQLSNNNIMKGTN